MRRTSEQSCDSGEELKVHQSLPSVESCLSLVSVATGGENCLSGIESCGSPKATDTRVKLRSEYKYLVHKLF